MKLSFASPLSSITSFEDTLISDFCVITGLNGSGKTHLLKAISNGAIMVGDVDPSEIIYYNYNDFTVHNGDPGIDQNIQQKSSPFDAKTAQFSQRINNERSTALNSFIVTTEIGSYTFGYEAIIHISDFEMITNWSDEDYENYNSHLIQQKGPHNENTVMHTLKPHQLLFLQHLGLNPTMPDIKTFVTGIKDFKIKVDAFTMIRNSGFSKHLIDWQDNEIEVLTTIDTDLHQVIWQPEFRDGKSPSFLFFIDILSGIQNYALYFDRGKLIQLRQSLCIVFNDIEIHYCKTIDSSTLNIIKGMNGSDKILEMIAIENGFLNLHSINIAEKNYQIQKKANDYNEYESFKGRSSHFLSESEFVSRHGESPVNLLNQVLAEYDCNGYEFKATEIQYSWGMDVYQQQIAINLYNKKGNYITTLEALSSGERTLLALSFTVFKLKQRKVIAKLFLMDEIDSSLHPSMSKRLLNVLNNLFHKTLGVKIILTTHSPSTIAFAPEDSIYVMKRDGAYRLMHTTRDFALNELTSGVPSFSINYENRRQVFVESQYDAKFYEALFNLYHQQLNPEISLNFIPSGDSAINTNGIGISNCDQVIKISKILRDAGNKFIWGIVDWDLNTDKPKQDYVKVLGYNSRYSMENYLLDPLLIAILLWREKFEQPEFFGFTNSTKLHDILNFGTIELQQMIDAVLNKLSKNMTFNSQLSSNYKLVNNLTLAIPEWFSRFQGHKLEDKYLEAFPKLNDIKRNKEVALKQAVIDKVIADYPDLAPNDFIEVLKQVQEY